MATSPRQNFSGWMAPGLVAGMLLLCLWVPASAGQIGRPAPALLLFSCQGDREFRAEIEKLQHEGARVLHLFPPYAAIVYTSEGEAAVLSSHAPVRSMTQSSLSDSELSGLDEQHLIVALAWNQVFMGAKVEAKVRDEEPAENDALDVPFKAMALGQTESLGCPTGAPAKMVSEYMLGSISLNVILPQSTGAIDISTETWDSQREAQVLAGVVAGAQWLLERGPSKPGVALSFTYHLYSGRTDARAATAYEPIGRSADPVHEPGTGEGLWTNEILNAFGYGALPDRWTKSRAFDNDTRTADGTNWAVTVFVADSLNDADGRFADNRFAYTWQPGSHIIMTYDNSGWGISRMGSVFAHELCHAFWARDEYSGSGCSCTQTSGYLNASNGNCAATCPTNLTTCVMRSVDLSGDAGILCPDTARQIGWTDDDGDGVPNAVQALPAIQLDSPVLSANQMSISGQTQVQAVPNLNPSSQAYACPITLARLQGVQVRIDGGTWANATTEAGFTGSQTGTFTYTANGLAPGTHTMDVQTTDTLGQVQTSTTTFTVAASDPPPIPNGARAGSPAGYRPLLAEDSSSQAAIQLSWDASCPVANTNLYWGYGAGLPTQLGGSYTLSGSACGMGNTGSYTWNGSPDPASDPSRLVWWVIVATDGVHTEGSWGTDSSGAERNGTQASGQCGFTEKNTANPGC